MRLFVSLLQYKTLGLEMSTIKRKNTGRPRDENARVKILEVTASLIHKKGYKITSIKDIALEARVGKQTIYRWWKNKAELYMETMLYQAEKNINLQNEYTGENALFLMLINTVKALTPETRALMVGLVAESIADNNFLKQFNSIFIFKRQKFLAKILSEKLEVDQNDERIKMLVDCIFGALWYRLIFKHRPVDEKFAKSLSGIFIK